MANSILPSVSLVAEKSLPALRLRAPFFDAFATNISADVVNKGEGVKVDYTSRVSASLYSGSFAPGDNTLSYATVTFGEPIFRSVGLTPNELTSYTEERLAKKFIIPMINDVLDEATRKIGVYIAANSGIVQTSSSLSASLFDFKALQNAFKVLDTSGSSAGNFALLDVASDYALQSDLVNNYGASALVIDGTLTTAGRTVGKGKVYQNYLLTAGTNYAYVCSPDAVAFAARVPQALSIVEQQLITDPMTGLTVSLETWDDPTLGKRIYAVKMQFAAAAGRPGMAVKFISPV